MIKRIKGLLKNSRCFEMEVLIFLVLIAGGSWLFVEIADEVMEGKTSNLDILMLKKIRYAKDFSSLPWLTQAARDITSLGGYTIVTLFGLIVIIFLGLKRNIGTLICMLFAIAGGAVLNFLLKQLFSRGRPMIDHLVDVNSYSFPSGHAMLSTVIYLTSGVLLASSENKMSMKIYYLSIGILLFLLVGITRLYLGVHYPTDILAGWIAGTVWVFVCILFLRILKKPT